MEFDRDVKDIDGTFFHEEAMNKSTRISYQAYFNLLLDDMINFKEEMTLGRKERINYMFSLYWKLLAPTVSYLSHIDRFNYQLAYIGDRMDYFDEENSVKAKDYLDKFTATDV